MPAQGARGKLGPTSGPSVADLRGKAASPSHSPCRLSQQRVGATYLVGVPEVLQRLGTWGATSLTLLSLPTSAVPLDELEALGLVVGQAGLEEHRVHPELRVQQGHVAIHLDKEVDTLVPLVKVGIIVGQSLRASRASEGPP